MTMEISKILQNAPDGLILWSPMLGECTFRCVFVEPGKMMWIKITKTTDYQFNSEGKFDFNGDCLLFPSKEKTWKNWQKAFFRQPQCRGSVIVDKKNSKFIIGNDCIYDSFAVATLFLTLNFEEYRFASPSETQEFNDMLTTHHYKWDKDMYQPIKKIKEDDVDDKMEEAINELFTEVNNHGFVKEHLKNYYIKLLTDLAKKKIYQNVSDYSLDDDEYFDQWFAYSPPEIKTCRQCFKAGMEYERLKNLKDE